MANRRQSIRRSTTLAMLTVGLVPVLVLGLVSVTFISRQVEEKQLQHDQALAHQIGRQIEQVIAGAVDDLKILATNPGLIGNQPTVSERREELLRINRAAFREISLLDESGFIVETTSNSVEVQDYSPWFTRARDRQEIFVSAPHRTTLQDNLLISFYIPVDPAMNSETAVIKATLSFDRFSEILESVETAGSDFLVLIDDLGHLLESTDDRDPLQASEAEVFARQTRSVQSGRWGFNSGRSFYYVTQTVRPPNQLDGDRHWTLVCFREPASVMAVMNQSYRFQGVAAGIGLIGAGLLGWLMARRLTRPIVQLREFSARIADGQLDETVPIDSRNEIGQLAETMNSMVSDLRKARSELEASLHREAAAREKEILLKEIHHRVKNNLQILASLFRMHARRCPTEEMKQFLTDSETRIRTMGAIHQTLYENQSLSEINLAPYIRNLSTQLGQVYQNGGPKPEIDLQIPDVWVGMDTALPCGLIVNELISNSLKYAFPDGRQGRITVHLKEDSDTKKSYTLVVSDNGVGFQENGFKTEDNGNGIEEGKHGSLGLKLVHMLADQLDGEAAISNGEGDRGGVTARVSFRESNYNERL